MVAAAMQYDSGTCGAEGAKGLPAPHAPLRGASRAERHAASFPAALASHLSHHTSPAEPRWDYFPPSTSWIETALEPVRSRLSPDRFEQLVSALAVVIGWEAFVVLFDVRGLTVDQARETITGAAITLLDGALAQAGTDRDSPN
jgi:hypothetical protein